MGVSIAHPPGPETTRALLERIAGGESGRRLRAQLARWNTDATREQIEDAFQEACARAERSCVGQVEGEVYSWLRTTAHREIARQRRRSERERIVGLPIEDLELGDQSTPPVEITAIRREDDAELARVTSVVLEQLSERQRDVVALHVRGLGRREIAAHLRLSPRTVKRSMEQILSIGREELVRLAGHGCEAGEGLVARFAFGLAGSREARLAELHLATCRQCGAMYERLDLWREKVAAVLPVPALAGAQGDVVERIVHAGAEIVPHSQAPVDGSPVGGWRQVGELATHLREHVAAAYYRAVDPTPLAGVRPGAAVTAVAGCLAIGGGATYCVEQGVNPVGALRTAVAPAQEQPKQSDGPKDQPVVEPRPTPPTAAPQPEPPPAPRQPAPQPAPEPQAPAVPPAPQDEYEPTGDTALASQRPSPPTKPAPAPAAGPGEFDGP